MKKIILSLLLFCCVTVFAQPRPIYKSVPLDKAEDYPKADPFALQACDHILKTTYKSGNTGALNEISFMIRWMEGSPDFTFTLDEVATKLMKGNDDMLPIFMACMGKFALENRADAKDAKKMNLGAVKLLIAYVEDPNHSDFKITKALKKLVEANKKGTLEKELE